MSQQVAVVGAALGDALGTAVVGVAVVGAAVVGDAVVGAMLGALVGDVVGAGAHSRRQCPLLAPVHRSAMPQAAEPVATQSNAQLPSSTTADALKLAADE